MRIVFQLFCETVWGEEVYIQFPLIDEEKTDTFVKMEYAENFIWTKEFFVSVTKGLTFYYRYIIKGQNGIKIKEGINKRNFSLDEQHECFINSTDTIIIKDIWIKQGDPLSLLYTSFFKEVLSNKDVGLTHKKDKEFKDFSGLKRLIKFNVYLPFNYQKGKIAIAGSSEEFGQWDIAKSKEMHGEGNCIWSIEILTEKELQIDYKYIIKDRANNSVIWEEGNNRHVDIKNSGLIIINDNVFRYKNLWKGAGICIPVFSIRTEKGFGTGEFLDLKPLIDWASEVGFKVIQILPVNDTTREWSWMDAYPYSCISAFALHPLYINIEAIGNMSEELKKEYSEKRGALNRCEDLEYEMVMSYKMYFLKRLFDCDNMRFLESEDFNIFFQRNAFWLKPYALFCALRDKFRTADFKKWDKFSNIKEIELETLTSKGSEYYKDVCFYYFIQYYLYRQLLDASLYGKSKGIALKGDIPIGIHPESHELWINPQLFHVDRAAGAPPDAFSEHGQNWGFPTYNWEKMAENNYSFWRNRLKNMSQYFHLIRLDHVLGFFRIWEIPKGMYSGMMGRFNPAIPVTKEELIKEGFEDIERLCEPYITSSIIKEIFGVHEEFIKNTFLDAAGNNRFKLKPQFSTQESIDTFLNSCEKNGIPLDKGFIRDGIFKLISNIILLKDEKNGFHFRFNMMNTSSFNALNEGQKHKLLLLYNDYFYKRQDMLWRKTAMERLPVLKEASDMLICGEDLGMIPNCVQPVMEELGILGLRIQRMPREINEEFANPYKYPYLTVCMTSTHDMPTLRGFWEKEDKEKIARFYKHVLGHNEDPPLECTTEIVQEIIFQHLNAQSMLAIFPIQDILALKESLRSKKSPSDEQINNPANPFHRWKYRMPITVEELIKQKGLSNLIKDMLLKTNRY